MEPVFREYGVVKNGVHLLLNLLLQELAHFTLE